MGTTPHRRPTASLRILVRTRTMPLPQSRRVPLRVGVSALAALLVTFASVTARAQGAVRGTLAVEVDRPRFHFTPPTNWTNDPNGMVWYQGEWHLFYQHNPFGDKWGHMSWGHAVSRDLVHWTHLPVALAEERGVMIFSGSAVVDRENTSGLCTPHGTDRSCLVAIYTGHTEANQSQHIAYSNDRGRTWTKYAGNPVLDIGAKDFRDPKVFWHAPSKRWVMVVSLATQQKLRLYASPDLTHWQQLSEFGPAGASNGQWECPDLFELPVQGRAGETRWVLVVNINPGAPAGGSGAQYFVGRFDGTTFVSDDAPTRTRWVDYGKDFYAAVSWSDVPARDGRRVWLGWMSNWEYANDEPTSPFRGAMTIPRALSLVPDGRDLVLTQTPVAELRALRGSPVALTNVAMRDGADVLTGRALRSDAMEFELDIALGSAREVALAVRRGGDEETLVGYDVASASVFIDRSHAGQSAFSKTFAGRHSAPMAVSNGRVRLRVFVDRSSVELFGGDGRVVLTDRIFPRPSSTNVALRAMGGNATLVGMRAWPMRAAVAR